MVEDPCSCYLEYDRHGNPECIHDMFSDDCPDGQIGHCAPTLSNLHGGVVCKCYCA